MLCCMLYCVHFFSLSPSLFLVALDWDQLQEIMPCERECLNGGKQSFVETPRLTPAPGNVYCVML